MAALGLSDLRVFLSYDFGGYYAVWCEGKDQLLSSRKPHGYKMVAAVPVIKSAFR